MRTKKSSARPLVVGFCSTVLRDGVGDVQHLYDIVTAFAEQAENFTGLSQYKIVILLDYYQASKEATLNKMKLLESFMRSNNLLYQLFIDEVSLKKDRAEQVKQLDILFQVSTCDYIQNKPQTFIHLKKNCIVINIGELTSTDLITLAARVPPAYAAFERDDFNFNFGLGPKGAGIKIKPLVGSQDILFGQLSKPIQALFQTRTMLYNPESQLIFAGYFKSDVVCATYIATILTSGLMQKTLTDSQLFFFVNLRKFNAAALSRCLLQEWQLDVDVIMLNTKTKSQRPTAASSRGKISIYVIPEYIESDKDHRLLYALTHHIAGCCGDNSLELAISTGKLPWFEVRDCKAYAWMEFLLLCRHYGAPASLITLLSQLQFPGFGSTPPTVRQHLQINSISEEARQQHMIKNSRTFASLLTQEHIDIFRNQILPQIVANHNFYNTFPHIIEEALHWHQSPQDRIIPTSRPSLINRYKGAYIPLALTFAGLVLTMYYAIQYASPKLVFYAALALVVFATLYYRQSLVTMTDLGEFPRNALLAMPSSSSNSYNVRPNLSPPEAHHSRRPT